MQLKNDYWYFESALSKKFCEELILYGNQKNKNIATLKKKNYLQKIKKN